MNARRNPKNDPTERVGGFYTSTDTTDTRARHTSPLVKHIISTSSRRSSRAASVDDAASLDARRALETALRRALVSAHGVGGGGSVVTEVLEATTTKASVEPPNAVMSLISEEDTEEEYYEPEVGDRVGVEVEDGEEEFGEILDLAATRVLAYCNCLPTQSARTAPPLRSLPTPSRSRWCRGQLARRRYTTCAASCVRQCGAAGGVLS